MFKINRPQRGQALILYALLLPTIFIFVGLAFDFGWWYLNLSRLQNAADAAALAGAHQIAKKESSNYLVNLVEEDLTGRSEIDSSKIDADNAQKFANKNLSGSDSINQDSWTDNNVSFEHYLIAGVSKDYNGKLIDDSNITYYKVELSETVNHLFTLMEQFGTMNIKATAIAKITKGFTGLAGNLNELKQEKVIPDWEDAGSSVANLRTVRAVDRIVNFSSGDTYRTEIINLDGTGSGNANSMETTGDWSVRINQNATSNNKYKIDDMFIDFRPDLSYDFNSDWDIGLADELRKKVKYAYQNEAKTNFSWQDGAGYDLRIIAEINFDKPYKVRSGKDTSGNIVKDSSGKELLPTDPLYVRIESDPIYTVRSVNSSVRQVVININEPNTETNADGSYKYRPLIIFYDGPIQLDLTSNIRKSKPVILNLNADFRGILFMPNSSVVINGNNNKFEGFVVAKNFIKLKTADDLKSEDYVAYHNTANNSDILVKSNGNDLLSEYEIENSDKVMVKNDSTGEYILVDKANLVYLSNAPEGAKEYIQVNNISEVDDNNIYFVDKSTLKAASAYDITTYVRPAKKSYAGTPVYVNKNVSIENGNMQIKVTDVKDWYEAQKVTGDDTNIYIIKKGTDNNGNDNFLLYGEGWRVITDLSDNTQYIAKKNNNLINSKDYIAVTDEKTGKSAYVHKNNANNVYLKIISVDNPADVKYIKKKSEVDYLTKVTQTNNVTDESGLNPMYVDKNGKVKYTDPIKPNTYNEDYNSYETTMQLGDKNVFSLTDDFHLNEDSHYAYFGIEILKRIEDGIYNYLNYEKTKDMFFTIDRANWIV